MSEIASSPCEVAIVSAFGRGELLAGELRTRGFSVVLADVTKALGERSMPDVEGPFPMVRPNPLLPAHLEWLMSHMFDEVPRGFSLWLKSGPLDFRGPLAEFQSRQAFVARFREHAASWMEGIANRAPTLKRAGELKFDDGWMIQLSHSFASPEFRRAGCGRLGGEPFPFHQAVQVPILENENFFKAQEQISNAGVQVLKSDAIESFRTNRSRLAEIAVHTDRNEALGAKWFVWCLSSEETASISKPLAKTLFPKGVVNADWAWRRLTIHSAKNSLETVIPPYVVILEDVHFPWAYENLMILKRRKPGLSDLWVRLPAEASRRPDQFTRFVNKLVARLQTRFPKWSHEIEPPWDEGPPLYPIFEPEKLTGFSKPDLANVIYEGAESLSRLDWAGRFQKQTETMLRLQMMKQNEAAKSKGRFDDSAIHAP